MAWIPLSSLKHANLTAQKSLPHLDVRNTYMTPSDDPVECARREPLYQRMREIVIPATAALLIMHLIISQYEYQHIS
jgi:hypothetical protein